MIREEIRYHAGDPRNRARVRVNVLNVMENQRLQIDLGHHCRDQNCQGKRNFLTKLGDSRARAHELMTSRSGQEATRQGTAAGGADKRRGLQRGEGAEHGGARDGGVWLLSSGGGIGGGGSAAGLAGERGYGGAARLRWRLGRGSRRRWLGQGRGRGLSNPPSCDREGNGEKSP